MSALQATPEECVLLRAQGIVEQTASRVLWVLLPALNRAIQAGLRITVPARDALLLLERSGVGTLVKLSLRGPHKEAPVRLPSGRPRPAVCLPAVHSRTALQCSTSK